MAWEELTMPYKNKEDALKRWKEYYVKNKEKKKEYRLKNIEKIREYSRLYARKYCKTEHGKVVVSEASRVWKLNNREKIKCHYQIRQAIRRGEIVKPNVCLLCKKVTKLNAHHKDYSKPLEVIWICHFCHKKEHKKEK